MSTSAAESARAVHSIVFALADPSVLGVDPASVSATLKRLDHLVRQALTNSRAGAEHLVTNEFGILISFLNSGAALAFVRVLQHLAASEGGLPIRIGVHMGSLGTDDQQAFVLNQMFKDLGPVSKLVDRHADIRATGFTNQFVGTLTEIGGEQRLH